MRIQAKNVWLLTLAVLLLAACVRSPAVTVDASTTRAVLNDSYVLGPGDELIFVVFNHEDLSVLCLSEAEMALAADQIDDEMVREGRDGISSGCAVVGEAGSISLPMVGEIRAAGRTVEAVRQDYVNRLADGYLANPNVSVNINKYRPFFIIGGVKNPGEYEYQAGMTITRAIALAGGRSKLAVKGATPRLLRANGEMVSKKNNTVDSTVFPGDFIEIPWLPPYKGGR